MMIHTKRQKKIKSANLAKNTLSGTMTLNGLAFSRIAFRSVILNTVILTRIAFSGMALDRMIFSIMALQNVAW